MNRFCRLALVFGCLGIGCWLGAWILGVSVHQSPRQATQSMIGISLPDGVQPTVEFSGILGPVVTQTEYIAHVRFELPVEELGNFMERLGCPYPSVDNYYECVLIYPQGPGGRPPANGTAESRLIQFRHQSENTVLIQMRLLAT